MLVEPDLRLARRTEIACWGLTAQAWVNVRLLAGYVAGAAGVEPVHADVAPSQEDGGGAEGEEEEEEEC